MGQHYVSYTKHISKSDMAKNPPVCKLCSECSKSYPWNKPDHQKTELVLRLHYFFNPVAFYQ